MNKINNQPNQQGSILPIFILIIVAGLVIFGYLYLGQDNSQRLTTQLTQPATKTSVLPTSSALISITKAGFTPSTITVAKDQEVTWVNKGSSNHQIISAEQLQLDSDILSPNDSFSATFEKSGTYTFKDKLNPLRIKGVVVVK